jgi:undecaprenyl-diphosphatase
VAKHPKPRVHLLDLRSWFGFFTRLERHEITWLLVGLGGCILVLVFLKLTSAVMEGETLAFDRAIVQGFRKADDASRPIGPAWIEGALLDITALGGPTVITLAVLAVVGFLLLQARYHSAIAIVLTAASGEILNAALKSAFMRPRPDVVPHLRTAFDTSFPSGHAMQSAIIYLTLGAMLMRLSERRLTKIYCCTVAMLATFLVGLSRVYLGVHYPNDVLAGWIVGLFWASVCWLVAQHYEVRAGLKAERKRAADAR